MVAKPCISLVAVLFLLPLTSLLAENGIKATPPIVDKNLVDYTKLFVKSISIGIERSEEYFDGKETSLQTWFAYQNGFYQVRLVLTTDTERVYFYERWDGGSSTEIESIVSVFIETSIRQSEVNRISEITLAAETAAVAESRSVQEAAEAEAAQQSEKEQQRSNNRRNTANFFGSIGEFFFPPGWEHDGSKGFSYDFFKVGIGISTGMPYESILEAIQDLEILQFDYYLLTPSIFRIGFGTSGLTANAIFVDEMIGFLPLRIIYPIFISDDYQRIEFQYTLHWFDLDTFVSYKGSEFSLEWKIWPNYNSSGGDGLGGSIALRYFMLSPEYNNKSYFSVYVTGSWSSINF